MRLAARAAAAACAVALCGATATRETTYGPVTTTRTSATRYGNVTVFASIPFAAPPLGPLRFAAPVPPVPWTAPLDTSALPPSCLQIKLSAAVYFGSEDCLRLSVTVPDACAAPGAACPVMLWIFGGAFIVGDEEELGAYDAANLAASQRVVVVAPQYRIGPFGFTALASLRDEDAGGSTGNAALQDQVRALEWTRDNVAAFGGDPRRVAIFGESAGGFSVCWHLVSRASAGLFSAAIMESGNCDSPQFFQPAAAAVNFSRLYAASLGCPPAANGDDAPALACMRALPAEAVLEAIPDWVSPCWPLPAANCTATAGMGRAQLRARAAAALSAVPRPPGAPPLPQLPALSPLFPWGPAIDGADTGLRGMPLALLQAGDFNRVPAIFGTNKNEGSIFVPIFTLVVPNASFPPRDEDLPLVLAAALRMFPADRVAAATAVALAAYNKSSYPPGADNFWRATDLLTHYFFTCGTRRAARAYAQHADVYLYQLDYNLTYVGGALYQLLGDFHTAELGFVFQNEWPLGITAFTPADLALSAAVQRMWATLAATGSPNAGGAGGTPWPVYSAATDTNLVLHAPPLTTRAALQQARCDVWDEVAAILGPPPSRPAPW